MAQGSTYRGALIVLACVGAAVLGAMSACQAPMEQKRGAIGEFCNGRDTDCREPEGNSVDLLCVQGVCKLRNRAGDHCRDICRKFDSCGICKETGDAECQVPEEGCWASCVQTIRSWGDEATQDYRDCYVDAACGDFDKRPDPQNYCYQELELPQARREVCVQLRDDARTCKGGLQESSVDEDFFDECRKWARTRTDDVWEEAAVCDDFQPPGRCEQMLSCMNERFQLDNQFDASSSGGGGTGGSGGGAATTSGGSTGGAN